MNIIYGGSFNPPTIAHYEIAKYILNEFPNSTLYFLPTNNSYAKNDLRDFNFRLKMLELVCDKLGSRAKVSNFEGKLDKYYGTYYTLSHFENPYFVMGADNLVTISSWINYPKLIEDYKFIILPRNNIDIYSIFQSDDNLMKNRNNFIILNKFKELDLSSSTYRKTKDGSLLLEEVDEFIKKNNLYKETDNVL